MNLIGFSSGALAKGDFRAGIDLQQKRGITAVEVSALRDHEFLPLVASVCTLDLSAFAYVSFHAPSRLVTLTEESLIEGLLRLPETWALVVHPDIICTPQLWEVLGERLCVENMDLRKSTGRTVAELSPIFTLLKEASFCFDLGHARQVDPTMGVALELLRAFGSRMRQLHLSEVTETGRHKAIGFMSEHAFRRIASLLPSCPVIIESIISSSEIDAELQVARNILQRSGSAGLLRSCWGE